VAVGSYLDRQGVEIAAVFTDIGGHWSAARIVSGPDAAAHIAALSCPASGECVAAGILASPTSSTGSGDIVIFKQTLGVWSAQLAPSPPDVKAHTYTNVSALDCPAPGACVATGEDNNDSRPIVLTEIAGKWTAAIAPLPAGAAKGAGAGLNGVACTSSGACVAVGGYTTASSTVRAMVLTLHADVWTAKALPLPTPFTESTLYAVACPAVDGCVAVGRLGATAANLIATESAKGWSSIAGPQPPGSPDISELVSVSCPAAGDCVAAGDEASINELTFSLSEVAYIDAESAGKWSLATTPDPTGTSGSVEKGLNSIACSSPGTCVAVGSIVKSDGSVESLIVTETDGHPWVSTLRSPLRAFTDPVAVSPGANAPPLSRRFAEDRTRATSPISFAIQRTTAMAVSTSESELIGVSCTSLSYCAAGGVALDAYGNTYGVLAVITNGAADVATAPIVVGAGAFDQLASLGAVSCPAITFCVAAGSMVNASSLFSSGPLVDDYTSGQWHPTLLSQPAGVAPGAGAQINAMACTSTQSCVAVGDDGGNGTIIVTLRAGKWSTAMAPLPPRAPAGSQESLASVSCTASRCVAIGNWGTPAEVGNGEAPDGVVLVETAGHWSASDIPYTSETVGIDLYTVSCPATGNCVAGGDYLTASGNEGAAMLEVSDGKWKVVKLPLPGETPPIQASVVAMSCSSASSCTAVGSYEDVVGNLDGLVVTGNGLTWKTTAAPLPANGAVRQTSLNDVACGASSCVAVGSYHDVTGYTQALTVTVKSGKSVATEAPLPRGAARIQIADLAAVACPSSCVAVGSYSEPGDVIGGLALAQGATTWTATSAALPTDLTASRGLGLFLSQLSCVSETSCAAIGTFGSTNPDEFQIPQTVLEVLSS